MEIPEGTPQETAGEAVSPAVSPAREPVPAVVAFPRKEATEQIFRFAKGEMLLHWAIAIPFMICFATGTTVKFFFPLHSPGLTRDVLTFVHKIAGGCLAVLPTLAVLRHLRDYKVLIDNVKIGFTWTIDDLKWLYLVGPSTVSKRVVLPEQRKFNAAERLNFMMVMGTYPFFVVTGVLLWLPGDHFTPWLIHVSLGLVAPLLMIGHIYMAVVNPDTRIGLSGMITGHVDREWAKHHYARWYRDHYDDDGTPKPSERAGQRA